MPVHPAVRDTLRCERCVRRHLNDCTRIEQVPCTSCENAERQCATTANIKMLHHFRTNLVVTIVDQTQVNTFLEVFNKNYKYQPLLLDCALAFAALHKEPLRDTEGYHGMARSLNTRILASYPSFDVNEDSWRAYYLAFLIFAPFSIQLAHSTTPVGRSYISEISNKFYMLRRFFARLGDFKKEFAREGEIVQRIFKNPVTYGTIPGLQRATDESTIAKVDAAINGLPNTEFGADTATMKAELANACIALFRHRASVQNAIDGSAAHPGRPPQHNNKTIFLWMTFTSLTDRLWNTDYIKLSSRDGDQHVIWKVLLCNWGVLHYMRRDVWYCRGVGERICNEFLDLLRADDKRLMKSDSYKPFREAVFGAIGIMGVRDMYNDKVLMPEGL